MEIIPMLRLRQLLFTVFCVITGFIIGALGALVLFAQCTEWLSFGNWNPVSVRYALNYFAIHPPHFVSSASGIQKIFNWLQDGFLNLPLSIVLLGLGGLIAAVGAKHAQQRGKKAREKSN
jgi:hypothetical protein